MRKQTILILLTLTLSIYTLNINVQSDVEENDFRPTSLELTPHDSIDISSNSGFAVFPGSGTAEDPYVIEGYNITTTDDLGIAIYYTTKYFTVRNCYVDAENNGIHIEEVADGTATVINNTCNNNSVGIHLEGSDSLIVTNNTCSNNSVGILLWASGSSTIANNTCNNNSDDGIYLHSSGSSIIVNNTCSNNNRGILLDHSSSSTVTDNTFNNNKNAIELLYSDFCLITYNLLQENEKYGVYLRSDSDYNIIHHNTFVDNNLGGSYYGSSQAYDWGGKNKWYDPETKEGNYWSNLGNECTYKIDGDAELKDLYPLNRAQSCPDTITMIILSIVLPLLVSVAILAFVVPKYVIPYFRKRKEKRPLRKAENKIE